jgi:integrase
VASIHKDPRGKSPYWYAAYTLPDGRRAFRSTKQRDRKKAADVARALEKAAEKARAGELTETTVRRLLDSILENVGQSPIPATNVRTFFFSWLDGKKLSTKPGVHSHYRKSVEKFLSSLGEKADRSLSAIVPADIVRFRDSRRALDHVSNGTLGDDIKTVRAAFSDARRQGLILLNPAEAVSLPTNRPLERTVFTPDELASLLTIAPGEWRTLVLCGYYLGGRLSDMASLSWDNVDLQAGVISFIQAKTSRRVEIPIHAELEEHLLTIADDTRGGSLCPTLSGTRIDGRYGLSNQFSTLMAKAGINRVQVQLSRNKFSRKSFHSLRHSFASALANAGVVSEVRMKLTGHRSVDVHRGYTHHERSPLKAAIDALPRLTFESKDH